MEIIPLCQTYLCFELLPSVLMKKRTAEKIRKKYTEYRYTRYDT